MVTYHFAQLRSCVVSCYMLDEPTQNNESCSAFTFRAEQSDLNCRLVYRRSLKRIDGGDKQGYRVQIALENPMSPCSAIAPRAIRVGDHCLRLPTEFGMSYNAHSPYSNLFLLIQNPALKYKSDALTEQLSASLSFVPMEQSSKGTT